MNSYDSTKVNQHVINCGYEYTNDIFILFGNVYIRVLVTKQYTTQHPGNVVIHRSVQSDDYLCYCYAMQGTLRHVDAKTFYTQFSVFKLLKQNHPDFQDQMIQEILDNNLSAFAFMSEHLL